MNNHEWILRITDKDRTKRIEKILSFVTKNHIIQNVLPTNSFPTTRPLSNIIIPAKIQKNKLTIMAHHDVFPGSSGFNDNSSGVVTLLKLQDFLPDDVELVFTDGEERGGQGCRYYLENYRRPVEAINIDVVGLGEKVFYEQYGKVCSYDIPKTLELFEHIPFSDSYILQNYKIPNILMLTGNQKECLIRNIFEAQHGGQNDGNIDLISESVMDKVFEHLTYMVEGNKSVVRL